MLKSLIWLGAALSLTLFAGPLAFVAAKAGEPDPSNLYIVIDAGPLTLSDRQLAVIGARDVGPLRGVLAKMIYAPPNARGQLLETGHIMLPAGALASLCRNGDLPIDLAQRNN